MARGNRTVVTAEPKGQWVQGYIGSGITTAYPGVCMQLQPATALKGGRHTWELYNADADGGRPKGPYIILCDDPLHPFGTAYAAGEFAIGYIPQEGDELNLMLGDVSGTGDAHTRGEVLIVDDGTGEFIATADSPENEVAQLLETVAAPTADTLAWCQWTGA